jgi:general secretion pathway protein C
MRVANIGSNAVIKAASLLVTAGFLAWSATHAAGLFWHVLTPDTELSAAGVFSDAAWDMQQASDVHNIDLERMQSVYVISPVGQLQGLSQASERSVQAADTRLALTLKGAIASNDPSRSRAIISNTGSQDSYHVGDQLLNTPGAVVLQAIYQTYVLLDNNGRIETLRMDEPEQSEVEPVVVSATINNATETSSIGFPAGINGNSALTELLRIQPVFESANSARSGALRGLQIRHGSRQDFLAAVGLQQGDLITAVDDEPLDLATDLPALMQQLSRQQVVSLQILRDQTVLTIELDRSLW